MKRLQRIKYLLHILICIGILTAFGSCNNATSHVPFQEGDLLFQCCASSSFSDAIVEATGKEGEEAYDHVGIFTMEGGEPMVLEASSTKGVVLTTLQEFIAGCPKVVAMRVVSEVSATEAVKRARAYLGKEYDWEFAADNDRLYCSELVQMSYLYADGTPAFESVEMNFRDSEGNIPQFWIDLFQKLGKPIPQGQPGTNPNSIAASPLLFKCKK